MNPFSGYTRALALASALCLFSSLAFSDDSPPRVPRSDWSNAQLQELARKVHENCLTIDTHMEVPIVLKRPGFDISQEHSWHEHASQVEISHASDKTAWDILVLSKAPIIASHSGCYACWPHPRNLNDPLLQEIARRDGVVQMNMFSAYMLEVPEDKARSEAMKSWFETHRSGRELSEAEAAESVAEFVRIQKAHPKPLTTVSAVVDHMVEIMGIEHVGISGDFDGGGCVEGSMDIGQMTPIAVEMQRRGYSEEDLAKFWGANVMRVLDACQAYAESL